MHGDPELDCFVALPFLERVEAQLCQFLRRMCLRELPFRHVSAPKKWKIAAILTAQICRMQLESNMFDGIFALV
jgi:hypothetical protein